MARDLVALARDLLARAQDAGAEGLHPTMAQGAAVRRPEADREWTVAVRAPEATGIAAGMRCATIRASPC